LLFLFLGLLILKFFQPRSISLYFNEQMQSLYGLYLKGTFDDHLDKIEQSKSEKPMDPLRFEDWCLNTYVAIKYLDEIRRFKAQEEDISAKLMNSWGQTRKDIKDDLEPLVTRRSELLQEASKNEQELSDGKRLLEMNKQTMKHQEESIERLNRQIENDEVGDHADKAFELAEARRKKAKSLSDEILRRRGDIELRENKVKVLNEQIDLLSTKIAAKESELENIQNLVSKERQLLANRINSIRAQYQKDVIRKEKRKPTVVE